MAGDGLVYAVVQTVLRILSSAALREIGLLWGLKDELNSLENTFVTIQLVLQDAELKQRKSEPLQNWLGKLKNAAYDIEDILDRIATEGLRRSVDSQRGMHHQFRSFLSLRNPLLFRVNMVHQVRNMRGKLVAIVEERVKFHLGEVVMENRFGEMLDDRHTSSLVNESEIVGRHDEKEIVIKELLDGACDEEDLFVYAIWGAGGLGKTTLAQLVYNDERTQMHFELRIWVCVSDDFSVRRLVREILESLEGGGCSISGSDPLQRRLQERLGGRRFLLVLDDVWNENHGLWDELKEVLRCGSKGSVLMATTRIEKVALMMATSTIHRIGYLSEDDSWFLFRRRAFPNGEGKRNLAAIGKVIVKKCGGVPLAIKALGSLMRYKSHKSEWLAIKESEIWHLSDDENGILPVLRLSYDNLLPQMRQCFAFCCLFPKDYVMEENQLIQLWMANGYIPSDGQIDMHLTGHLIFKELVWRSFFQDVEINFRGDMTCKMHDLMHDLALSVMKYETCIIEHGKEVKIPKALRHLCFYSSTWEVLDNKSKLKLPIDNSLRSIIVHGDWGDDCSSFISKQKHLRALDVNHYILLQLPKLFSKLEHLRYLAMSCYNLKKLPESLTCLLNLQTLKLTDSKELQELPKSLRVMKNLWFVDIETFDSLLCTPPGLGDLTCLRGLSIFIVGQDAFHQIDQLKELDLGGKLSIQGLDNVRNLEDARSANLIEKKNLSSLSLSWLMGIQTQSAEHFEEVLQGLQPHQNIEKICIKSYQGSRFPKWLSTLSFEKLKEIRLECCPRCKHLPPLGKLPSLTDLTLHGMNSIKCLDAELHGDGESSFPALIRFTISGVPNLEEWTTSVVVESFPCLQRLKIWQCPKLTGLPKLPTLRRVSIIDSSSPGLLRSIMCLTSLTLLVLFGIAELDVFPEGLLQNHTALENLRVGSLPIRTLPNVLDHLSALKSLSVDNCSNLEFLPEGLKFPNSLERLDFRECNGLRSFPATMLEGLTSLRSLSFQGCMKLKPLSGPLKRAPPLHDLLLNGLPELEHLPESVQHLSALRELRIWLCKKLCSMPSWLTSLESLRRLEIGVCPQLEKRCRKPKGEDWPKISHIPIILINNKAIQRSN